MIRALARIPTLGYRLRSLIVRVLVRRDLSVCSKRSADRYMCRSLHRQRRLVCTIREIDSQIMRESNIAGRATFDRYIVVYNESEEQIMLKIRDPKDCRFDLVSLGESMIRLSPPQHGRI